MASSSPIWITQIRVDDAEESHPQITRSYTDKTWIGPSRLLKKSEAQKGIDKMGDLRRTTMLPRTEGEQPDARSRRAVRSHVQLRLAGGSCAGGPSAARHPPDPRNRALEQESRRASVRCTCTSVGRRSRRRSCCAPCCCRPVQRSRSAQLMEQLEYQPVVSLVRRARHGRRRVVAEYVSRRIAIACSRGTSQGGVL